MVFNICILPKNLEQDITTLDLLDDDGKVDCKTVRKSWAFKNGVERIWQGLDKGFTISLMCSESEPLDCHRFSMISIAFLTKMDLMLNILWRTNPLRQMLNLKANSVKEVWQKLPKPDMFNPNVSLDDQLKEDND